MPTVEYDAIPEELKARDQWLLWDAGNKTPRRPHWDGDFTISWSDPDDWHSFAEAKQLAEQNDNWGIGYVMAQDNPDHPTGLYGCLDLDGCLETQDSPKDWLPSLEEFIKADAYIERSPSGDGLHIPLVGQEAPDWWTDSHFSADEHEGVEWLTHKFCTFTGDRLGDQDDGVAAVDPTNFLYAAYETLNDEAPRKESVPGDSQRNDDLTEEQVEEALSYIDSGCSYPMWRDIGFAVHDWDSGLTGKRLFEDWSRGPAWDDRSEEYIESIWDGADNPSGDPVTVATLIHHAMDAGWEPGHGERYDGTPTPKELIARHSAEFDSAAEVPDDLTPSADADPEGPTDETTASDSAENDDSGGAESDEGQQWAAVYQMYREAEDADERLPARHAATEKLLSESHWRTLVENDQLWQYDADAGIYRDEGEMRLRERLVEQLQEQFRANEQREISQQIRGRTMTREEQFGGPDNHIACQNCVLEVRRDEITVHDHSPEYEFVGRTQTEYDPDADCPRFKSFLKESVDEKGARKSLQEYAGYALMQWALPYHKALFLVGPTASGKSTFLDTIRAMLGEDATASLTPQQMTSERFGGAELYGKWANIRNDIPASVIEDTGQFKEITAGDPIKAEEKYQDPFMFEPTAKHMFSANQLPEADTDDEAFFRRILLVAFPETVPRGERDPNLDAKLQDELAGVLNWAVEGLQRLMRQGRFSRDRTPGQTQDTWDKWGNSVDRFAQLCLAEGDNDIPKSTIYSAYQSFCRDEGIPTETQHAMTRKLKLQGFEDGKAYAQGSQQRVFLNIQWTGRGEQYLNDNEGDTRDSGLDGYDG